MLCSVYLEMFRSPIIFCIFYLCRLSLDFLRLLFYVRFVVCDDVKKSKLDDILPVKGLTGSISRD